jgi:flagellar biosynthetic protein FliO
MKRKAFGIALSLTLLAGLIPWNSAHAVLVLKQVQVSNGNQIELQFDREVDVKAIKTEFYQDIIQLSLNNVSVYPPKIFSVDGSDVSKVFAYQYTPKLVRCRLTVKGKAEDFKSRIVLRSKGKFLTLLINGVSIARDRLSIQSAKALSAPTAPSRKVSKDSPAAPAASVMKPEDKSLFEKITQSESPKAAAAAESSAPKTPSHLTGQPDHVARATRSHESSMSRVIHTFAWMAVVLILMAGVLVFLKKAMKGKNGSKSWMMRMMKGKFGAGGKLIEVEATHYLGPKKSIAVVKVQGRRLVLGITDESINLITQLGAHAGADADGMDDESDALIAGLTGGAAGKTAQKKSPEAPRMGTGAMAGGSARFADILASADSKPAFQGPESTQRLGQNPGQNSGQSSSSVRDQIRKRVEGLKNL